MEHSCELNYLFDVPSTNDTVLAKKLQTWWTNFAIYNDPNGNATSDWPAVNATDPHVFMINDESVAAAWPETDKCAFWKGLDNGRFMSSCNDIYWENRFVTT